MQSIVRKYIKNQMWQGVKRGKASDVATVETRQGSTGLHQPVQPGPPLQHLFSHPSFALSLLQTCRQIANLAIINEAKKVLVERKTFAMLVNFSSSKFVGVQEGIARVFVNLTIPRVSVEWPFYLCMHESYIFDYFTFYHSQSLYFSHTLAGQKHVLRWSCPVCV